MVDEKDTKFAVGLALLSLLFSVAVFLLWVWGVVVATLSFVYDGANSQNVTALAILLGVPLWLRSR